MLAVKVIEDNKVVAAKVIHSKQDDTAHEIPLDHFHKKNLIEKCFVGLKTCAFPISKMIEIKSTDKFTMIQKAVNFDQLVIICTNNSAANQIPPKDAFAILLKSGSRVIKMQKIPEKDGRDSVYNMLVDYFQSKQVEFTECEGKIFDKLMSPLCSVLWYLDGQEE